MVSKLRIGMNTEATWKYVLICMVGLCLVVTGCNSSSDSGDSSNDDVAYTGRSSPAQIGSDNIGEITSDSMSSESRSTAYKTASGETADGENTEEKHAPALMGMSLALQRAMGNVYIDNSDESPTKAATREVTDELTGQNGGKASLKMKVNTDTGEVSGTFVFDNYREDDLALTGSGSFKGAYDTETDELKSFVLKIDRISAKSDTESLVMSGELSIVQAGDQVTFKTDVVVKDVNRDITQKIENYSLVVTETGNQMQAVVSGRLYHQEHGYVDIATDEPFVWEGTDDNPSSGVMRITGGEGEAGGKTQAVLTAVSATHCRVQADTNGDGSFDYDTGEIPWDQLDEDEDNTDSTDESTNGEDKDDCKDNCKDDEDKTP